MNIKKELWGTTPEGKEILFYTLKNASGAYVKLCNIGAAITSIVVPDKNGKLEDVVLGYANPLDYFGDGPCMGKVPGRFANRIAKGKFTLDGKEYTLPINNGPNHLHGGPKGFMNQVWDSRIEGNSVEFMYFSEDGEEGYPGNMKVVAHYTWSEDNSLKLILTAECDAPTVVNLTNHVYVNLNGEGASADVVSRSVARDDSSQTFNARITGNAPCNGHTECDSIIMDNGRILAIPSLEANNVDAMLVHEAAIGKIAGDQLTKLMTLGLTEQQAEEQIINGFLR